MYGEGQEASTSTEEAIFGKARSDIPDIEGHPSNPYDVDPSNRRTWWDEMVGKQERPSENYVEFFETVEVPGERFVEGSDAPIPGEYAFGTDEMMDIESAVDRIYDETSEFVDDVVESVVHPQQSKQIERWFNGEIYKPNSFDESDGYPVME